ncbi:hypothetical protein DB346_08850 [Verrucomicrobia bacterium LW23]|nr:hypothetical protein DB346_08850 [Verrucomicrobia bacterium LW23]
MLNTLLWYLACFGDYMLNLQGAERLDLVASLGTLYCVHLTVRRNIWCWPVGMIASVFAWELFNTAKLYADRDLQVYFIAMSLYGWYNWRNGGAEPDTLPVSRTPARWWPLIIGGVALVTLLIAIPRLLHTDARIPIVDTLPNVLSLVAQVLLTRKYLEAWILWIIVDIMLVGVYASQGLWYMMGTYTILLAMATQGLLAWRAELARQEGVDAPTGKDASPVAADAPDSA